MLKSSVKCRYILQVQIEIDDIANIFSRLDCEYERFGEIYPMMVTDNTFRVQLEKNLTQFMRCWQKRYLFRCLQWDFYESSYLPNYRAVE